MYQVIPPENVHAAKKILANCCGREKPDVKKLAVLLGLAEPPHAYESKIGIIAPRAGVRAFCAYAIETLGGTIPDGTLGPQLPEMLSKLLTDRG